MMIESKLCRGFIGNAKVIPPFVRSRAELFYVTTSFLFVFEPGQS